jgi:hypothetical protein
MSTSVAGLLGYLRPPRHWLLSSLPPRYSDQYRPPFFAKRTGSSSHELRLYFRAYDRFEPPRNPKTPGNLPWDFAPYRDISTLDTSIRRVSQSSPTFRPQRSSRSRRFPPQCALRVCFTSQPRVRFTFQGFSPLPSRPDSSSCRCPHDVPATAPTARRTRRGQSRRPHLQGVDPDNDPLPPAEGLALLTIRSPLKFSAPAGSASDTLGTPSRPLRSRPSRLESRSDSRR